MCTRQRTTQPSIGTLPPLRPGAGAAGDDRRAELAGGLDASGHLGGGLREDDASGVVPQHGRAVVGVDGDVFGGGEHARGIEGRGEFVDEGGLSLRHGVVRDARIQQESG